MNVVHREKRVKLKQHVKSAKSLLWRDPAIGIRGSSAMLSVKSFNPPNTARPGIAPRYKFNNDKVSPMGPPLGLPKPTKRKIVNNTSSSKLDSYSSGRSKWTKVLANDSTQGTTSNELCTPRTRPTALKYISGSSRGHSGSHSIRSNSVSVAEPSVILAISEGRGMARGEIGIAAVDLRRPQLILCQFSDTLLYTHTLTKINFFNPIEIIVPHTFCEGVQPNQLFQLIRDHYPGMNLTTVQRRHFNDAVGRRQIQTLCAPEYSAVYLQVLQKFYALTAAAAVLKYVEYIQCVVFARESLKIEYHSSENTMIIDIETATQLELVQPLVPSAGPSCCLLGVIGPTYTIGGIRALRAAILQPSCNKQFIENRLDAVQELIDNDSGLMVGLQVTVKKMSDVDKILLLCIESPTQNVDKMAEAQLNQTLLLKTTIDLVPNLVEALNVAESGRLVKIKMDLENPHYKEISDRIKLIIQDDAHVEKGAMGSLQRCFAVKPNINGLLDVARRTYSELIEDIQKIVETLSETYDMPIRLNQNAMKGFHIVLNIGPKHRRNFKEMDLPPVFIQVQNSGVTVTMTTEELVVLDQQAKESLNEILKMSNVVIQSLLKELRPFMSSLYKLCENVAELDILLSLAQASSIGSYIRPEFSNYLSIKNSVHPLLDYNSQVLPIPNDICASPEYNFNIITGPNMGGKSIYIKQVALMQIMAQLGCFLPATNATLRLCDRIFSRLGFNDSVELNASTFVLEMKEIQHILKGLTPTSLVVIDELCRGTSSEEGASLAWAICEEFLLSEAFTFFTTHFHYLTRLQDLYCSVVNLHTIVTDEIVASTDSNEHRKRLIYEHKIVSGVNTTENYGLSLAANTNLPAGVVNLARELAEFINRNNMPQSILTPDDSEEFLLYKLNAEIRNELRINNDAEEKIKQLINNFKVSNPKIIERLLKEISANNDTVRSLISSTNVDKHIWEIQANVTTSSNDPLITYKPTNYIPKRINTLSTDLSKTNENTVAEANYASVKSINELLYTVIDNSEVKESKDQLNEDVRFSDMEVDKSEESANNITGSPKTKSLEEENSLSPNDEIYIDSDSDVVEALTQVLVEYEVHNDVNEDITEVKTVILDNNSDNTLSSCSSVDDVLMKETVDEINEELNTRNNNIQLNILTPPMGFRDDI